MKQIMLGVMLALLICSSVFAQGSKVTIDLTDLDPETAAQVLQAQKIANGEMTPIQMADQAEQWANVGVAIGEALSSLCEKLGTEANELIKTPVGALIAVVVIWEMVGQDIWSIVGGSLVWVVLATIIIRSHRYYHKSAKVTDKDGNIIFVRRHEFAKGSSSEWTWEVYSNIWHGIAFTIITVICALIVFT